MGAMTTHTPIAELNERADAHASRVPGGSEKLDEEVSVLDLLIVLALRKRFIFLVTAVFTILAAVISLILPPSYTATVTLLPPHVRKGEYDNKPIAVWCIRIWEAKAPPSVQPLEWVLLTYLPVETPAQAWTMTSYYECRFVIEEYHKAQKTGCQIEDLQFETAQALQPMIALLSVVATVLLNLRQAC